MCAENQLEPLVVFVQNEQHLTRKLLHSYPEMIIHLLVKYLTDQYIAENDSAILRYTNSVNMTHQTYGDDLVAKSCSVADV